jgi:VWFA-related protein
MANRCVNQQSRMFRGVGVMVLVAGACGRAQVPAGQVPVGEGPGGYTLQVNAQRVVLDVVVTDRRGANVQGLTKDDFVVLEDGAPQEIRSFDETVPESKGAKVAIHSTAELDRLEPDAPVSILVIDEVTTTFEDLAFARYSLKKYLKGQGDTLDQPTMLVAANYRNVAVLRDYTTSKQAILDALDHHRANYSELDQRGRITLVGDELNASFRSLIGVAQATAGHAGHKNMVWMGRGFPTINMNGLPQSESESYKTELASCTRLLRDSRVTLYMLDPVGVSVYKAAQFGLDAATADPFATQLDFDAIAVSTGGSSMHGRNDLNTMIEESARGGESFYTLSYRPSSGGEDPMEFRHIRIGMKDKNLRARTREGYYAGVAAVTPLLKADGKYSKRVVFDFKVASESLLNYDGVAMTVTRDPTVADTFYLQVRAADLPLQGDGPEKKSAELMVVLATFDRHGTMVEHNARLVTAEMDLGASGKGLEKGMIRIPVSISTTSPAVRVRFVVRANGNGKMGAGNIWLDAGQASAGGQSN